MLLILTNIEKWFYFCRLTNIAFHDLTIGKMAPKALQSLLRHGVNFCPTPLCPSLNIDKSMERFERDLHIYSVFAGSEDLIPLSNPKIYFRSKRNLLPGTSPSHLNDAFKHAARP